MSASSAVPPLKYIYRLVLRSVKRLPAEPSRGNRALRVHVEEQLRQVRSSTIVTGTHDAAALWQQAGALRDLVENTAMKANPLPERITSPVGSPHHYHDLAKNAGDMNAPSRRTPLQSFLFRWFRLKI